jgi:G:T-mismatch repair DNA endonuclease (very short patch repair protein)
LGFLNETRKIITPSGSIIPDFICGSKVVEYYGDYWHCHENMFSEEDFNYSIGMTAKEKRRFDFDRAKALEKLGYEVKIVWECDFTKDRVVKLKEIEEFIKNEDKKDS